MDVATKAREQAQLTAHDLQERLQEFRLDETQTARLTTRVKELERLVARYQSSHYRMMSTTRSYGDNKTDECGSSGSLDGDFNVHGSKGSFDHPVRVF